jgi:transcriptional regulator with XRE-family HTH domain
MEIGRRLFELREAKGLSQGDIEEKSGLLRCYISRVENGHTVPALETLEKLARALDMPLYALLYDGTELPRAQEAENPVDDWTSQVKGERVFKKLRRALAQMGETDRQLLLEMAEKMAGPRRSKKSQTTSAT